MTDRDRLKEKIDYLQKVFMEDDDYDYFNEFLADRLLEDKDVIVPPCKVGDVVYYPSGSFDRIFKKTVDEILVNENESDKGCYIHFASTYMPFENIGKTVFLTIEEAEQALKEREGK